MELELKLEEAEDGELAGRYHFGFGESWTKTPGSRRWGQGRFRARDTTFQILTTGAVGQMGGPTKSMSGDEIFQNLWEVPHVLPDGPVELGMTWEVSQRFPMRHSHFTEIETRYRVVDIQDEDVWIEFSGSLYERLSGGRNGYATEGAFSGRLGFRRSLGAVVGWEWDYDYRTGHIDRTYEFTEYRQEGSFILEGLEDTLPLEGVTRLVEEKRDDKKSAVIWVVIGAIALGIGAALGMVGG
jgi:hypothetical protein